MYLWHFVLFFIQDHALSIGKTLREVSGKANQRRHFSIIDEMDDLLMSFPTHGSLQQYLHYEELTNDKFSDFLRPDGIFKDWTDCVNQLSISYKNVQCIESNLLKAKETILVSHPFLQIPREMSVDNLRFIPNCNYEIIRSHASSVYFTSNFLFLINTTICSFNVSSQFHGGSSFSVFAKTSLEQVFCDVYDGYCGVYAVLCKFHHNHLNLNIPLNISVFVDYEHFDAFSEVFGRQPPMQHEVFRGSMRSDPLLKTNIVREIDLDDLILISKEVALINREASNATSNKYLNILNGSWSKRNEVFQKLFRDNVWTGKGNYYPNTSSFHEKFMNPSLRETILYGPSHVRFLWDWVFYLYFGALQLSAFDRKHSTATNIPGLSYSGIYFAADIGDVFYSVECSKEKKKSIVFQFGSWDLNALPLRALIRNPTAALHVIEGLKVLLASNRCSSSQLRLIWLTDMPYPTCIKSEFLGNLGFDGEINSCEKSRGYRNNYAISAFNQWFTHELEILSSNMIVIVDAYGIISPRLIDKETSTCGNHFLYHPKDSIMIKTSGGVAAAGEVLNCAMWDEPSDYCQYLLFSEHNLLRKDIARPPRLEIIKVNISEQSTSYFLLEGGVMRLIPDVETLDCFSRIVNIESLEYTLSDFSFDSNSLPTRKNGNVLVSQSDTKDEFKIENCVAMILEDDKIIDSKIEATDLDIQNMIISNY